MSEALHRYEGLLAGTHLRARTMPIQIATTLPNTTYSAFQSLHPLEKGYLCSVDFIDAGLFQPFVFSTLESPKMAFRDRFDAICSALERLKDGWSGPSSIAPASSAITDLNKLLPAIPAEAAVPEVEVDEAQGDITLRWTKPGHSTGFSFVLRGDGRALGVKTAIGEKTRVTSHPFDLRRDQERIARFLVSDEAIAQALTPA